MGLSLGDREIMNALAWLARGDRWIPALIVAGFVVIVMVNGTMIWIAVASWTGVATSEAYNHGLNYNETLAEAEARDALGWSVALTTGAVNDGYEAELMVTDVSGASIDGAEIVGRFVRPTHEGFDFNVDFRHVGAGRYVTQFVPPLAGQWILRFEIDHAGDRYRAAERVSLTP